MSPRSVLSVPGSSPRMLEKAWASAADEIVIDLEDAVAPGEKDAARDTVLSFLSQASPGERQVAVRVNAPRTPWCHLDLAALAGCPAPPHTVVVPKVESAGDLAFVDRLLAGAGAGAAPLGVQALVESAAGLVRLGEICGYGAPLVGLILGYADLAASLGRGRDVAPTTWGTAQDHVVWAARAASLRATDGPWLGTRVDDDFLAAVRRADDLGFDGKWVIHPGQIEAVNDAFTPDPAKVTWAHAVVATLDEAETRGLGAVQLDGQMLDEAVAVSARRVLARAARAEVAR